MEFPCGISGIGESRGGPEESSVLPCRLPALSPAESAHPGGRTEPAFIVLNKPPLGRGNQGQCAVESVCLTSATFYHLLSTQPEGLGRELLLLRPLAPFFLTIPLPPIIVSLNCVP